MTQFKLTYEHAGGHVHYSIWVRTLPTETWAKSGHCCLSKQEWTAFIDRIAPAFSYIENRT